MVGKTNITSDREKEREDDNTMAEVWRALNEEREITG